MQNEKKCYFVAWEGYQKGDVENYLDRLCLQGPHTLDKAHEIKYELHKFGLLASVIEFNNLK